MSENAIVLRLRVPNNDPQPRLNAAGSHVPSPGSDAGYTFHHIMPWRQCVLLGASLLKLAVYGDDYSHRPSFRGAQDLRAPQEGESVGNLFDVDPELTKKRLMDAASGMLQPSAKFSNDESKLLDFMRARLRNSETTQLDRFLGFHAGIMNAGNVAQFARPPFAGFWGMQPQQREDDPGEAPEKNLPQSMDAVKAGLIQHLVKTCQTVLGPATNVYDQYTVRASSEGIRTVLNALEPLTGRLNTVHPFTPSDWLFRPRGDVPFFLPWAFAQAEDLGDGRQRMTNASLCRDNSFRIRLAGEGVTGRQVTQAAADVPLVINDPGRPGSRASMYLSGA